MEIPLLRKAGACHLCTGKEVGKIIYLQFMFASLFFSLYFFLVLLLKGKRFSALSLP